MSKKAGQLLWSRQQITISGTAPSTTIDTGLCQLNKAWAASSLGEPGFGSVAAPSRVQVIPMAPLAAWSGITHAEPTLNPTTGTVEVTFFPAPQAEGPVIVNVLFWNPHTLVGPGDADLYNDPDIIVPA